MGGGTQVLYASHRRWLCEAYTECVGSSSVWLALGEVRVWRQDVAVRPAGEREAGGAP
ncbi:hypothetical protein APR12_006297 [Nocardia amikacinitolerans]|nr:hypothetical protein [Nocardia amikacinitolerans]